MSKAKGTEKKMKNKNIILDNKVILVTGAAGFIGSNLVLKLLFRTALLSVFVVYMVKRDLPIKEIPLINKLIKK